MFKSDRRSILALALCAGAAVLQPAIAADEGSTATPHYGVWGFDLGGEDKSVKPGDDFFRYANGTYLKTLVIPSDRTRYGNFDALTVLSENRLHAILDEEAAHPGPSATDKKIAAFYKAYMDEARIEKLGLTPAQADLAKIKAAKTKSDIAALMGASEKGYGGSIVYVGVRADAKDPDHYTVYMGQSGLGLPDRDYYLKPDFAEKKAKYQAYIEKLLTLAHWPKAAEQAKAIVAFETQIAEGSWTRVERRDGR